MVKFLRTSAGDNRFDIEVSGDMCDTLDRADPEETKLPGFEAPPDYVSPMPHDTADFHSRLKLVVRPPEREILSEAAAASEEKTPMPHWNNAGLQQRVGS